MMSHPGGSSNASVSASCCRNCPGTLGTGLDEPSDSFNSFDRTETLSNLVKKFQKQKTIDQMLFFTHFNQKHNLCVYFFSRSVH